MTKVVEACRKGIVHLRPRYHSSWVCLHRSKLGDIVAVLLLRDHPHVLVLVFLIAAPSNLVNVIMSILLMVGPCTSAANHLTALLLCSKQLSVFVIGPVAGP